MIPCIQRVSSLTTEKGMSNVLPRLACLIINSCPLYVTIYQGLVHSLYDISYQWAVKALYSNVLSQAYQYNKFVTGHCVL